MEITKIQNGSQLEIKVDGRLDTNTAPELEEALKKFIPGTDSLKLNFADLAYVSSAGLRVLLSAQKQMNAKSGKMVIANVNETVMDVFEVTGFSDILSFE